MKLVEYSLPETWRNHGAFITTSRNAGNHSPDTAGATCRNVAEYRTLPVLDDLSQAVARKLVCVCDQQSGSLEKATSFARMLMEALCGALRRSELQTASLFVKFRSEFV